MGTWARAREQLTAVTAAAQELPRNLLIIAIAAGAALVLAAVAIFIAGQSARAARQLADCVAR